MRHSRPIAIALASSVGLLAGCASVLIPSNSPANASAVVSPPGAIELDYSYHSQQDGDWCDPADIEMLEDLIVAAHRDAKSRIDAMAQEEMQKVTGGLQLPLGMKLPF